MTESAAPQLRWEGDLLRGTAAVVTGAAQGIGLAIARQLSALGSCVVLVDVADGVVQAAASLPGPPDLALPIVGDVRSSGTFERAIEGASERWGVSPSVLVSNAGIVRDRTIRKMSREEWDQVVDVHLNGAFVAVKSLWEPMIENGGGSIVFISSASADGARGQANYSSAKSALIGLMRTVAIEGARHRIRSNAVKPGAVDTAMVQGVPRETREQWMASMPFGRFGEPEEIAHVVAFLASPLASFVSGATVAVDGAATVG